MGHPRAGKELVVPPMVAQKKILTDDERAKGIYSEVFLWDHQEMIAFGA